MSAIHFNHPLRKRSLMELEVPDWSGLEGDWKKEEPFVLWRVGFQPLLHHWLDYALNEGFTSLRLYCPDKPHLVRRALEAATLWPIEWELIPAAHPTGNIPQATSLPGFPGMAAPAIENEWDLLEYWFSLERECFNRYPFEGRTEDLELWIGRFSHLHPTAKLNFPLWIGDNVYVGPNCEIGPYASIGHHSVIEGNSSIVHAKVEDYTFLGAHTSVEAAYLDGDYLIQRKHRVKLRMKDAFVASKTQRAPERKTVSLKDRVSALGYWLAFSMKDAAMPGKNGVYWRERYQELLEVTKGRRQLFGVLPRSRESLDDLSPEWREILNAEQPGVFSYSDTLGFHEAGEDLEPVHAVYQATHPKKQMDALCRRHLKKLIWTRNEPTSTSSGSH